VKGMLTGRSTILAIGRSSADDHRWPTTANQVALAIAKKPWIAGRGQSRSSRSTSPALRELLPLRRAREGGLIRAWEVADFTTGPTSGPSPDSTQIHKHLCY